jgi:NAD(P) transhydrogenase subunit alpha
VTGAADIAFSLPTLLLEGDSLPFLLIGIWVLLLATFLGFELIQKVPPTLHTPLMSGSNAISGITIVGSLYCVGHDYPGAGTVLGCIAVSMAMVNVVGGFAVTNRMLSMFSAKKGSKPASNAGSNSGSKPGGKS